MIVITVARKPISTLLTPHVIENGCGALNIDACRIGTFNNSQPSGLSRYNKSVGKTYKGQDTTADKKEGRWPTNLLCNSCIVSLFPHTKSGKMNQMIQGGQFTVYGKQYPHYVETYGDEGSTSRFFKVFGED